MKCRLRQLLVDRGQSVTWLVAMTMKPASTLYNWMGGKSEPLVSDAIAVARALGVQVEDLWEPTAPAEGA
ncbi:MAG TPA: helix-turn-helix transcriptional regulator [Candidatus Xenobia bacterium]|jgi:hypothetical protein